MKNGKLTTINPLNEIRERIGQYQSEDDPERRLKEVSPYFKKFLTENSSFLLLDDYKTLSINEFNNGLLMCESIPDQLKTFAIEMMRNLQQEYNCQTTSEKATCEIATMAFIQTLKIQQLMNESETSYEALKRTHTCGKDNSFLGGIKECVGCNRSKIEIQHYVQLGKELDRANRHYLTAIQTLRMMKQPPMQVNIRTNTAVVGQNQMVQTNSHE